MQSISETWPLVGVVRRQLGASYARIRHRPAHQLRPSLAQGVRLLGPVAESAFAEQPWLVERNGRFLQLTELLYRVAELADGTRSIDAMARDLSRAIDAQVSPEFIQRALETRLIPIGLIAADASLQNETPVAPTSAGGPRSPLGLNMRVALISPRIIGPATSVLQILYVPPVLVLLLLVTLQAQAWLFFVHGVTPAVEAVIQQPEVVPIVVGLLIGSAAFHELGHAAALRYGGGHVRGMGVGLYLLYPAFYTDVTDNYRLRRWARVRTDLGGFYFNLLFSLALLAVYHASALEYLLLVVVLIDLDIIHQCLPFVRLDGYWALADLTGIPDFFLMMGAYLRSVFPFSRGHGRKLPRLKWWAKAIFALYILLALPATALFLFVTLRAAPRLLVTAWEAIQVHIAEVARAQATGDMEAMAGAEAQMLLLVVPVLGLGLMLLNLARTAAHWLWLWGRPTAARRLAATVLTTAGVVALAMALIPGGVPLAAPAGQPAMPPPMPLTSTATLTATSTPTATETFTPPPTSSPTPGRTLAPTRTSPPTGNLPQPVRESAPVQTAIATPTPVPTDTATPVRTPHPLRPTVAPPPPPPTRPAIRTLPPSPRPSPAASPAVRP